MKRVLFIDTLNFENFPAGGALNFACQMLKVFGDRLCLVGVVTDNTPLGQWVDKEINGITYKFFALSRRKPTSRKPLIPPRITGYIQLLRYRREILAFGVDCAFIQSHHVMLAVSAWGLKNLCYCFHGVENPLTISRYKGAKAISEIFDRIFFKAVSSADILLAAANTESINNMVKRSKGCLHQSRIVQFPTRVDTFIFRPSSKTNSRNIVGFPADAVVVVTSGRIHWAKGWKLLIDAFLLFIRSEPRAYLCFIGDGEDRANLTKYAMKNDIEDKVKITGFKTPQQVATYLNAGDLYVSGSYIEGWSTSMVEALSCALPIVTTEVSSAHEIVNEGANGYVVEGRDTGGFAAAMCKALALGGVEEFSIGESKKYALKYLARDLGAIFPPLEVQ